MEPCGPAVRDGAVESECGAGRASVLGLFKCAGTKSEPSLTLPLSFLLPTGLFRPLVEFPPLPAPCQTQHLPQRPRCDCRTCLPPGGVISINEGSTLMGGEGVRVQTPAVTESLGKIDSHPHPLLGQPVCPPGPAGFPQSSAFSGQQSYGHGTCPTGPGWREHT